VAKAYTHIPPQDQEKAKRFFQQGRTVGETGQYEYAIEMYLQGLSIDPDAVDAHQALREIALRRKAAGGRPLGIMERMKLRATRDDKQNMLNAEKLLAYDPGNTDYMVQLLQNAYRAGFYDTVLWIGPILLRANAESKSPDVNKYIILKDIYKDLERWKLAVEACQYALRLQPDNMELHSELKNLSANETMFDKGYAQGGNFRTTMADREKQEENIQKQKDVVGVDLMLRAIEEAEADYKTDPTDGVRLNKLVDALLRLEDIEHENRAIELLEEAYARTKHFPYRQRSGRVKMRQLARMERSMRAELENNPKDEALRRDYEAFVREKLEFELREYQLALQHYPTDPELKFEVAERLFALGRFDEAIPMYQQARSDPKHRVDASIGLGRAFLEAGFVDEAIETLEGVIQEYPIKGDERSKLMHYWQGRAYEAKGNMENAVKRYSQVAQWEFTYQDVQQRIKRLRAPVR